MFNYLHHHPSPSSLRNRLMSSMCYTSDDVHVAHQRIEKEESSRAHGTSKLWTRRSPSRDFHEIRCMSKRYVLNIGRRHHRSCHTVDFSYDPSSYALNFEDDNRVDDEEFRFRNFAARLPATPRASRSSPALGAWRSRDEDLIGYSTFI